MTAGSGLLLGIIASQITGRLSTNSYESIATVNVSSNTSTISFSSIPSTFKHLQLRFVSKTSAASGSVVMQFNGDTGTNYSAHYLLGSGSAASASAFTSRANMFIGSTNATANVVTASIVDVLEYANTNINKTIRCLEGFDSNGGGEIILFSGNWRNTSAVTSITIFESAGASFTANSQFALYGIRG